MQQIEAMRSALLDAADPVSFAINRLAFQPDPWQCSLLRSTAAEIAVNCSRQSGKSTTVALKALHVAKYRPDSLTLIISPTQRQSGLVLKKARRFLRSLPEERDLNADSATNIELGNGSCIVSLPGNDDSIRGFSSPDLIIEDEAAFVTEATHDSLVPMMATGHSQLILLSTPQGRLGHFYEACTSEAFDFERFKVTANDCPRITKEFLEKQRRRNPARFGREFMCEFLEADGQFFSFEDIEAMFDTDLRPLYLDLPHDALAA